MKLTDLAVEKYRPDKKRRREILDGGCEGLYLVVQPSGFKSWAMRFRRSNGGKPAKLTLGPLFSGEEPESEPVLGMPLTLVSARKLAAEVHRQRAMGRDPIADYEAAKRRQKFDQEKGGRDHVCRRRPRLRRAARNEENPALAKHSTPARFRPEGGA